MSSEACPYCGKTYKRLKSHLPHCKAAASSTTPQTKHDVTANQASSSSHLAAASSDLAAAQTLSMTTSSPTKKSKKVSVVSSNTLLPSSQSSASLPVAKKKKQKLSEQIKTANLPSSTTVALTSSPSMPSSPTISKPKKQSLRALIEAAKPKQVSKGSRSDSEDLPSGSAPFVADPLSSRTTAKTKTNPDKGAHSAFLSADTKPKAASIIMTSKTKKALSTAKDTSKVKESIERHPVRDDFWVDKEGEVEDLSVNQLFLKTGSGHQARITLQDVKATLGRANAARPSSRPSILTQIKTSDDVHSSSPVPLPTGQKAEESLKIIHPKHAALVNLQPELSSPAAPLLSGHLSSPPLTVSSRNEGLKVTGLVTVSPSLTKLSSPLPTATLRAHDDFKSQLEVERQNTADKATKGLPQRRLGQVRLKELPEWLACKTPRCPREVVETIQRGWQWYYKKYIDVKKGGVGGPGMLLAGYCVLSYIWSYPHIKRDRWRKYH